jgi:PAS domain S-box-containing protein
MVDQKKYDDLVKEYRELQLRVTRFSFIEQQLINTRDQLDHELILYKRLNQFNNEALKYHSDAEFFALAAETIVDILEIEASTIYIVQEQDEELYVEGIKNGHTDLNLLKQESILLANKVGTAKTTLLNKRLFDQFSSLDGFNDAIFHAFEDEALGYKVYLLGLISVDKSPFYEKLQSKHETIFSLFAQQFQSLISNRIKSKKLSASELELKKLSLIATKTKNGVIISDHEGKIEWVNESFSKTTGYLLEEVIGKKPKEFLQRNTVDSAVQEKLSTALRNKENIEVQIVNYNKEGNPYYNLLEIIPVFDEKGKHINFISLQKDISSEITFKEKILEINSRYELITEKSKIGIWEWIKQTDYNHWSDILLAQYGTTRDEINGNYFEFWKSAIHPDDKERVLSLTNHLIESTLDRIELEYRIIRANDGTVRYIKNLTIAERNAQGEMLKLIGSSIDITEELEAEQKIIAREQKYRGIIDNVNLGLIEVDTQHNILFINSKFEEITQLKDPSLLAISGDPEAFLKSKKEAGLLLDYHKTDDQNFEVSFIRADQKEIHLLISTAPVLNQQQQFTGYISIYLDITSIRSLQLNLEKTIHERDTHLERIASLKQYYESILGHSPSKIAVFNPDLVVTYLNEALIEKDPLWKNKLGWTLDLILSNNPAEARRINLIIDKINEAIATKSLVHFDDTRFLENGAQHFTLRTIFPYYLDDQLEYIIMSGTDITELKLSQEDILNKNSELQKVNTELDNFVYRVSHDLRGPLLSIKGLVSLIFTTPSLDPELTEYITLIESSVIRLDETIQEILEYSKNARLETNLETFDVQNLVQDIFNDIKFSTDEKVKFEIDIVGDVKIYSDKYRINTVLKNIIGNAVKYRKTKQTDAIVQFSMRYSPTEIIFELRDNGEGISPKNISKVFNMFYRASSSSMGTGLGLYICKEIITRLNGTIDLESELGVGTLVRIVIPKQLN